jgi:hypothetical protein
MRIDRPVECFICHRPLIMRAVGSLPFADQQCEECGLLVAIIDGSFPVVERLMIRSSNEFKDGDWTLPIVLDAMACETLVAILHRKWTFLPSKLPHELSADDEKQWEQSFRRLMAMKHKIDGVAVRET